jgi:signal transduction histidine kinase
VNLRRPSVAGLQVEIVANLFVVMLAGLAIVAVVMATLAARTVERAAVEQVRSEIRQLERTRLVGSLRLRDLAALVATLPPGSADVHWTVLDARGREVGAARSRDAHPYAELASELGTALELVRTRGELGADLLVIASLATMRGEGGWIVGRVPSSAIRRQLAPILRSGAWVLATAAAVFVAFGAYLLRWRIVRPVQALEQAVHRVAGGDLSARTDVSGSDELAQLARGFNHMAESLARERDALEHAQSSLSRSQRLATVGQLAAGVAHEVGNPVAAILGYAELLLREAELSQRGRLAAECVRDEALRVRELVRDLLDLARSGETLLEDVSPAALLDGAVARLRPQPLLAHVELLVECEPDLPPVRADRARVEQILINLVENAAHALAGAPGGRIELRAVPAQLSLSLARRRDDPPVAGLAEERRPDAVALLVVDDGPGIDAEDQPHVFDPFFTTKEPGAGTGLGLWNAHRIAELLGGWLELESAPGRTCFRLLLPIADTANETGDSHAGAAHPDHR